VQANKNKTNASDEKEEENRQSTYGKKRANNMMLCRQIRTDQMQEIKRKKNKQRNRWRA